MFKKLSKRFYLYAGLLVVGLAVGLIILYVLAQSLLGNVLTLQLRQAGFPQATADHVRIYVDGIVIGHIQLNEKTHLHGVFTPQSPPDIAQHGLRHVIVKQWEQTIATVDDIQVKWPFPKLADLSVEDMRLTLNLPQQTLTLSGTLKSLQPDTSHMVLLLPFDIQDEAYALQGKIEMDLENGQPTSIDVNLEDGSYQSQSLALKRLSGWFNAQMTPQQPIQVQAQFIAGSVLYNGQSFADGMIQYSRENTDSTQWTVTLNRAAENYFNSWVIKPTHDQRFAIQTASQSGPENKTAVMITAAPLQLEPLLPAP